MARYHFRRPLPAQPALQVGWLLHCHRAMLRRDGSVFNLTIMDASVGPPQPIVLELPDDATPLDFLVAVYRHPGVPLDMRLDAAKSAASYLHPKLAAIVSAGPQGQRLQVEGGLPRLPGVQTKMPAIIDAEAIITPPPDDDGA